MDFDENKEMRGLDSILLGLFDEMIEKSPFADEYHEYRYSDLLRNDVLERIMRFKNYFSGEFWEKLFQSYDNEESMKSIVGIDHPELQEFIVKNPISNLEADQIIKSFIFRDMDKKEVEYLDFKYCLQSELINFYCRLDNYEDLVSGIDHITNLREIQVAMHPESLHKVPLPKFSTELVEYERNKEIVGKRIEFKRKLVELLDEGIAYLLSEGVVEEIQKGMSEGINVEKIQKIVCGDKGLNDIIDRHLERDDEKNFILANFFMNFYTNLWISMIPEELLSNEELIGMHNKAHHSHNAKEINNYFTSKYFEFWRNENRRGQHLFQTVKPMVREKGGLGVDDSLSINLDTLTLAFGDDFENELDKFGNPSNFLLINHIVKFDPGYVKSAIYHLKLDSFEKYTEFLAQLYSKIFDNFQEISSYYEKIRPRKDRDILSKFKNTFRNNYCEGITVINMDGESNRNYKRSDLESDYELIDYPFRILSEEAHEKIIKNFELDTIDKYTDFFASNFPSTILINISPGLFDYFSEKTDDLEAFYENQENLKVSDKLLSLLKFSSSKMQSNLCTICDVFQINSYTELSDYQEKNSFLSDFIEEENVDNILHSLTLLENMEERKQFFAEMIGFLYYPYHEKNIRDLKRADFLEDLMRRSFDVALEEGNGINEIYNSLSVLFHDKSEVFTNIYSFRTYLDKKPIKHDHEKMLKLMEFTGGYFSSALMLRLSESDNVEETIEEWEKTIASIKQGGFDGNNQLHKDLEYLSFLNLVESADNISIIDKRTEDEYVKLSSTVITDKTFSEDDPEFLIELGNAEIYAVAYEAMLLSNFITEAAFNTGSKSLKTILIPNMSYGVVPVLAMKEDIMHSDRLEVVYGIKVPSTGCHNNPLYNSPNLFKTLSGDIMNEQPDIIIVDGTTHLKKRKGEGKGARYPDAHTGYLNEMLLINLALDMPTIEWPERNEEFRKRKEREIEHYRSLIIGTRDHLRPYSFEFWNTAGMDLIIREEREEKKVIRPYQVPKRRPDKDSEKAVYIPDRLHEHSPKMIFCNAGVLHDQLPDKIKEMFEKVGEKHIPAYFDDNRIIKLRRLVFSKHGLDSQFHIESKLREAYAEVSSMV